MLVQTVLELACILVVCTINLVKCTASTSLFDQRFFHPTTCSLFTTQVTAGVPHSDCQVETLYTPSDPIRIPMMFGGKTDSRLRIYN